MIQYSLANIVLELIETLSSILCKIEIALISSLQVLECLKYEAGVIHCKDSKPSIVYKLFLVFLKGDVLGNVVMDKFVEGFL